MSKPYLKSPTFHAASGSPSQDQLYVPAWSLARVQEALAHIWSSFAQDHDPADGTHRTCRLPTLYALVACAAGPVYTYTQESGFAGAITGTGDVVCTLDTGLDADDYRWVVQPTDDVQEGLYAGASPSNTTVTVYLRVAATGTTWTATDVGFVLLGFKKQELT